MEIVAYFSVTNQSGEPISRDKILKEIREIQTKYVQITNFYGWVMSIDIGSYENLTMEKVFNKIISGLEVIQRLTSEKLKFKFGTGREILGAYLKSTDEAYEGLLLNTLYENLLPIRKLINKELKDHTNFHREYSIFKPRDMNIPKYCHVTLSLSGASNLLTPLPDAFRVMLKAVGKLPFVRRSVSTSEVAVAIRSRDINKSLGIYTSDNRKEIVKILEKIIVVNRPKIETPLTVEEIAQIAEENKSNKDITESLKKLEEITLGIKTII